MTHPRGGYQTPIGGLFHNASPQWAKDPFSEPGVRTMLTGMHSFDLLSAAATENCPVTAM